ncbi:MAG: hypothetical protein LBU97_03745, partial [Alistipes sp.]|nr:hypothetical protein [Alistipes sp.]
HNTTADYAWKVNGSTINTDSPYLYIAASSVPSWRAVPVECAINLCGGQYSGWSKVYVYVSPTEPTWPSPAPAPAPAPNAAPGEDHETDVATI